MQLSEDIWQRVVQCLRAIGPDGGKTRLERVSGLSRFLGCAELIHQSGQGQVSLAVGEQGRNDLIPAVGRVLALDADGLFTPDFVRCDRKHDYSIGSNFLTTGVRGSRGRDISLPNRPAPLLNLTDEVVTLHLDFRDNLRQHFQFDVIRVPLCLWLVRNNDFAEDATSEAIVDHINTLILERYGPDVGALLTIQKEDFQNLTQDIDSIWSKNDVDFAAFFQNEQPMAQDELPDDLPRDADVLGRNLIFYGAPGTGKSHRVNGLVEGGSVIRTVFHPDTQNSDFFGSLKPRMDNGRVAYAFSPGPFALALRNAYLEKALHHHLVIEELNRAPAAAVFGELFQLLDRNDETGRSTYTVNFPTPESQAWFSEQGFDEVDNLHLPENLTILATMNSADQGVYPLDTAFRRRWEQFYIPLYDGKGPDGDIMIPTGRDATEVLSVEWKTFVRSLNNWLVTHLDVAEDRLLGLWFVKASELRFRFPTKILLYLWDDLLRHEDKTFLFKSNIRTFGQLHQAVEIDQRFFSNEFIEDLRLTCPDEAEEVNDLDAPDEPA